LTALIFTCLIASGLLLIRLESILCQGHRTAWSSPTHFTWLFSELRSLPYHDRLRQLGLWSLQEHRNRSDLIELFELVTGFSSTPWNEFFHKSENNVTRGHSWKLLKSFCHCEARLQFFSQRVINRWNSLSQEDVDVTSVNAFKGCLERRRRHQMDFF